MDRNEFERLVTRAVDNLPDEFQSKLENIDLVVRDWPNQYQSTELDLKRDKTLSGLDEGLPQT